MFIFSRAGGMTPGTSILWLKKYLQINNNASAVCIYTYATSEVKVIDRNAIKLQV